MYVTDLGVPDESGKFLTPPRVQVFIVQIQEP